MQVRTITATVALFAVVIFSNANASDSDGLQAGQKSAFRVGPEQKAQSLIDDLTLWIGENFDLPAKSAHPQIRFATQVELMQLRIDDLKTWHGVAPGQPLPQTERNVVAVYDTLTRTVYLPDNWRGEAPADQSILVHELVHHLQNVAGVKFECPAAREKTAYLAQQKWLSRFGRSLENDFDIDMFTVVVSSACM